MVANTATHNIKNDSATTNTPANKNEKNAQSSIAQLMISIFADRADGNSSLSPMMHPYGHKDKPD